MPVDQFAELRAGMAELGQEMIELIKELEPADYCSRFGAGLANASVESLAQVLEDSFVEYQARMESAAIENP